MEEQLRQEIAKLCKSIEQAVEDAPLAQLIHQLEALQEKLIVVDYLRAREARFIENTQRLKKQLLNAVAATPLDLPTATAHQMAQTSAEVPKPVAAQPEPVLNNPEPSQFEAPLPEPEREAAKPTPAPAPEVSAPPTSQNNLETIEVAALFDAFEPDTTPQEPEKPVPAAAPKALRTQDFVPNPEPVITAKPAAKAWEPKQEAPAKAAPSKPETLGDKVAQTGKSSLNDRLNKKAINIGLNDRLAFVKHLFAGSQEDYNRVISQLNTQTAWDEAENFIANFVKPDYDWSGKEEYEARFMDLVRLKFEA